MHARIASLFTALAFVTCAASSSANAGAPYWRTPNASAGAWVDGPSPVLVTHEDLRITCREIDHAAACSFVATYSLLNSSNASVTVRGSFYGTSDASVELDGRSVRTDNADRKALDAVEERSIGTADVTTHTTQETPFELTVVASAHGTLVFRGKLSPTYGERGQGGQEGFFVFPAYRARHPVMSGELVGPRRFEFQYLVYPLRSWAGQRAVHIEVRWPGRWDSAHPVLDGAPPFTIQRGSEDVATVDADGATAGTLGMAFRIPGRTVVDGGPFIGVGGQFSPGEVRLRAGWELAGPSALSYSLAVETNAKDCFAVAAVVEASLPNLLFVPGLGFGAGPIFGWSSVGGAYGGARLQAALSWPFITLVLPVDIVAPNFTTGTDKIIVASLLGQLSF